MSQKMAENPLEASSLALRKATLSDRDEVMRISKNVYLCYDYLPHCYDLYCKLEDNDDHDNKGVNLVMVDPKTPEKVLGYQSYLFQGQGRRQAIARALRVDDSLRGRGLGKAMMALCAEHLATLADGDKVSSSTFYCSFVPVSDK